MIFFSLIAFIHILHGLYPFLKASSTLSNNSMFFNNGILALHEGLHTIPVDFIPFP